MSGLRDKVLLLVTGLALSLLMLGGVWLGNAAGFRARWAALWPFTVLLALVLLMTAVREVKRRRVRLKRRWPLVGSIAVFFVVHLVVLGVLLEGPGRNWGMPHFYFISVLEVVLFALVFEWAYAASSTK